MATIFEVSAASLSVPDNTDKVASITDLTSSLIWASMSCDCSVIVDRSMLCYAQAWLVFAPMYNVLAQSAHATQKNQTWAVNRA